jgi:cell division protein FtsQ
MSEATVPIDVRLLNLTTSVLVSVAVLVGIAAVLWWAIHNPAFSIRGITVLGDVAHNSAASLRGLLLPQLKGNFFTLDLKAAKRAFETAPWVRRAIVQREFPNRLKVTLQEHEPVAHWGDQLSQMVNKQGEVFEASGEGAEYADLPVLIGPDGQAASLLSTFATLSPHVAPMHLRLKELELMPRGSWRAGLDNGAEIALGRGTEEELEARLDLLSKTAPQIAARHRRTAKDIVLADMRYPGAYALKLRGVTTMSDDAKPTPKPKSAAPKPAARPAPASNRRN